jgi:hypothetical protein
MLLDDIKKDIYKAYCNADYKLGDENDMTSKAAISLLHEVELQIYSKMTEIKYIHEAEKINGIEPQEKEIRRKWNLLLGDLEKERKEARQTAQKDMMEKESREKAERLQLAIQTRMNKPK